MKTFLLATAASAALLSPAFAQTTDTSSGAFGLGQIETVTVTETTARQQMSTATVSNDTAYTYNLTSLDHAVDILPGVAAANSGGPRNEQLIFVRGFDRFEVPLTIDGIRVYLPADNRLDFGRFLTADLSQVQVAKGYVSVLNGPGALGGTINLVTRKPQEEYEVDARVGSILGNSGSLDTESASLSVGTRQDDFYFSASGAWSLSPRFELPEGFAPTATENGGFRDHSRSEDWSLHLKAGYTPNDTDEYSLNYMVQQGSKDAPFAVSDPVSTQRDWTWPYWDISSVYFLSSTALSDTAYVKTRVYYNTFTNGLFSYDNANYNSQTTPKAFRSYYDDYAYGGNVEAGIDPFAGDTLKASVFYRRDSHDEWETIYSPAFTEPHQLTVEDTWSAALENTYHITSDLDAVVGASYDWRHLFKAQDFIDPTTAGSSGTFVNYPLRDGSALNGQAALIWRASDSSSYYINISDRTRFPTIFERFSTRFNSAASNPGLRAERAANTEIGTSQTIDGVELDGSLFYSDVSDAIESVILPPPAPTGTTQSQNVGHGTYYGAEASLTTMLRDDLELGANYTWQVRHIRTPADVAPLQLTGDPMYKGFIYLAWAASPEFSVTPNLDLASNRWTVTTNGATYYKTGAYGLLGVSFDYRFASRFDLNFGIKNMMDSNYQLSAGFPEQGRTFFAELRFRQ
ncbi:MAG TPA: TonB-dependent receptor [Rhizomicrobium sp.]|nr:TonB-dependent receptor [Rhizomicrobium sp.]